MPLSVIGSGFGRTGTRSLKDALELLGFAPCHHMEEVFQQPQQVPYWQAVAAGRPVDWHAAFDGYGSQVDWPGSHVWRELAAAFPRARVIHSVRPEEAWWSSFSQTIGKYMTIYRTIPLPPHARALSDAVLELVGNQTFGGRFTDRAAALTAYRLRTQQVREALSPERLLVFDVAEGWAPLCRFLQVPVPDMPFPNRNSKSEFWDKLGGPPR